MSFFSATASDLFGKDVTQMAEGMLSSASAAVAEATGGTSTQEPSEEDVFKTSLGYFVFPSDPLSLVSQTLQENKETAVSTATFVIELNPAKVFAKELKNNESVTTLLLVSEAAEEVLCDETCKVLAKGMDYRRNFKEIQFALYPETPAGKLALLKTLSFQTKLEKLTLLASFLDTPEAQEIFLKFMQESKTLKDLTLQCLGEDPPRASFGAALAKGVMTCVSLEKLRVESYRQNLYGDDPAQLETLLDAVAMSTDHFELSNLFLGDAGIKSLRGLLDQSITSKLMIRNCHLSPLSIKSLQPSFMANTSLVELDLGGGRSAHGIGNDGAMVLANVLKGQSEIPLKTLVLQHAGISDHGVVFLGNALKMNSTLTKIDLRHNDDIGEAGLVAMGNALKDNSTLTTLWMVETLKEPVGLQGLALGLSNNMTLKSIREGEFVKQKKKDIKRELERLDLLIKFNNEANYEAKSTYCSEYSITSATAATTIDSKDEGITTLASAKESISKLKQYLEHNNMSADLLTKLDAIRIAVDKSENSQTSALDGIMVASTTTTTTSDSPVMVAPITTAPPPPPFASLSATKAPPAAATTPADIDDLLDLDDLLDA